MEFKVGDYIISHHALAPKVLVVSRIVFDRVFVKGLGSDLGQKHEAFISHSYSWVLATDEEIAAAIAVRLVS